MCIADMKSKHFGTSRHTWPIIKCTRTGSRKKHQIRGTGGREDGVNTNKRRCRHQVHELVLREKCPFPVEQPPRGRYIANVFVSVCVCVFVCVFVYVCVCACVWRWTEKVAIYWMHEVITPLTHPPQHLRHLPTARRGYLGTSRRYTVVQEVLFQVEVTGSCFFSLATRILSATGGASGCVEQSLVTRWARTETV